MTLCGLLDSYYNLSFASNSSLFETCSDVRNVFLLSYVNYALLQTRIYVLHMFPNF